MKYLSTAIVGCTTGFILVFCANSVNAQYVSSYNSDGTVKPVLLNTLVNKAYTFFSTDIGEFIKTESTDLGNGVITSNSHYKSVLSWPGSSSSQINKRLLTKNGVVRRETYELTIYFPTYDFQTAEKKYRELYDQVNGSVVSSPSGQSYTLNKSYDPPVTTIDGTKSGAMVDFNQLFSSEKIDISLHLAHDENGMSYSYLTISRSK
ncbi:MAG TPA: hypothetical protein VK483_03385 [Chitinophagaceae bacterium]|nr:hypothetical protein [Chitinophagaceae bacterium]